VAKLQIFLSTYCHFFYDCDNCKSAQVAKLSYEFPPSQANRKQPPPEVVEQDLDDDDVKSVTTDVMSLNNDNEVEKLDDIDVEEDVEQTDAETESHDINVHENAIINQRALVSLITLTFKCEAFNGSITGNSIKFVNQGCATICDLYQLILSKLHVVASAKSLKVNTQLSTKITCEERRELEEPSDLALMDYQVNQKMVLEDGTCFSTLQVWTGWRGSQKFVCHAGTTHPQTCHKVDRDRSGRGVGT
jgi:hypothetical protein